MAEKLFVKLKCRKTIWYYTALILGVIGFVTLAIKIAKTKELVKVTIIK